MGVGVSHWRAPGRGVEGGAKACDRSPQPLGPGQVSHLGWPSGSPPCKPEPKGGCSWLLSEGPGYSREADVQLSQLRPRGSR